MVHIAFAEIFHSAVAISAPNSRHEGAAAVTTGEQSGIAVRCGISVVGLGVGFQHLLMIPSMTSPKQDPGDWYARFVTVKNTFSARIGQICNAALDRSVIAYNEKTEVISSNSQKFLNRSLSK